MIRFALRPRMLLALVAVFALVFGLQSSASVGPAEAGKSRLVSGWFGHWTSAEDMIRIAKSSNGVLGEVNIFWWSYQGPDRPLCTTSNGSCLKSSSTPWTTKQFSTAVKGLKAQGIQVYASHTDLSSYWARSLSKYLATHANRKAFAKHVTDWVVKAGVDGIDLDWENFAFNDGSSTWGTTKPRFIRAIDQLSRYLHAAGKKLSVTVPAGYAPFKNGKANPGGGYWVYAWQEIAPKVDRLRLMAYDYSWNRPGPIGPHAWADQAAAGAVAQVGRANRSKIFIGVHQYGKAWYARDSKDGYVTSGTCRANWRPSGPNSISLSPTSARNLAAAYGKTPQYHSGHKEWTFRYLKSEPGTYKTSAGRTKKRTCKVWKEVWYGDTNTAVGRADIVKKHRIGGLAVWELSSTRSDFYPRLRSYTNRRLAIGAATRRPATSSTFRIAGRLPGAGKGVLIRRQQKVRGKWRTKARARTNSRGRVSFKVRTSRNPRTYYFRLRHSKGKSKVIRVVTNPRPKISFTRSSSKAGAPVIFRAKVTPAVKGQRVTRQIVRNGRWTTLQTRSTGDRGVVKFRTRLFEKPQAYRYRVVVRPSVKTSGGRSRVMRFTSY